MSRVFIAVDTNILVYAHNLDSEWNANAREIIRELAAAGAPWAIPWPCVHEFLSVATSPRIFPEGQGLPTALNQVTIWMESPSLRLIGEMADHWGQLERILTEGRLRGGAVHDARIAAICVEHGVTELWSADRDFSRISRPRVRNPLV